MMTEQFRRLRKKKRTYQAKSSGIASGKNRRKRDIAHVEAMLMRSLAGKVTRAEEVAALFTTRTLLLGSLGNLVELLTMANSIAMGIFIMSRSICRRPDTDRLGLIHLHHIAVYTCTPTLLITRLFVVFTDNILSLHVPKLQQNDIVYLDMFIEDGPMVYAVCILQCTIFTVYVARLVGQVAAREAAQARGGMAAPVTHAIPIDRNRANVAQAPRALQSQPSQPPTQASASRGSHRGARGADSNANIASTRGVNSESTMPYFSGSRLPSTPIPSPGFIPGCTPMNTPLLPPIFQGSVPAIPASMATFDANFPYSPQQPFYNFSHNLSGGGQTNIQLWQQQNAILTMQAQLTELRLARARIYAVMSASTNHSTVKSNSDSDIGTNHPSSETGSSDSQAGKLGGTSEMVSKGYKVYASRAPRNDEAAEADMTPPSTDSPLVVEIGQKLSKLRSIRKRLAEALGSAAEPQLNLQHPGVSLGTPLMSSWTGNFADLVTSAQSHHPQHHPQFVARPPKPSLSPEKEGVEPTSSQWSQHLNLAKHSSSPSSEDIASAAHVQMSSPERSTSDTNENSQSSQTNVVPSASVGQYRVGQRVRSRWQHSQGQYYNAVIAAINSDGTYEIDYEDGDKDSRVDATRLSLEPWVRHNQSWNDSDGESDSNGDGGADGADRMSNADLDRLDTLIPLAADEKARIQDQAFRNWVQARLEEDRVRELSNGPTRESEENGTARMSDGSRSRIGNTNHEKYDKVSSQSTASEAPAQGPASHNSQSDSAAASNDEPDNAVIAASASGPPLLRAASQDPILSKMNFVGSRTYHDSPEARAASFKEHKAKFLEYALKRYQELERYRRESSVTES